ncbi:MAG: SagB/ThcOx family dehydrogenase [Anaerolineae bacterium]
MGCATTGPGPNAAPTSEPAIIPLPAPRLEGDLSLEAALAQRRSVRSFTDAPLTLEEIGQLLWAAQGVTRDWGGRTAPSAGALYPLELYIVTQDHVARYRPDQHAGEVWLEGDRRQAIWAAGLEQEPLAQAPMILAINGVYQRTQAKYGERAERYVLLEAGHVAQNVLLEAVALGLGAVPIGAFYEDTVAKALELPAEARLVYLIPVGHPQE